jgi:uncharacterized protein (DUF1684 family)
MRVRIILSLAAVAIAVLQFGCGEESSGMMSTIPPPEGWREALLEQRAAKDREFKTDPETPLLAEDVAGFEGLDYWPLDPGYYFVGRVNLYFDPEQFEIVSTSGKQRPCEKAGWIAFEHEGQRLTLQVYRLLDSAPEPGSSGYFLPFMDGTTGKESYPSGRYVDLLGPPGGPFVLDFNTAYNPLCAYGSPERFVCPVTPSENRLPVRIEAGERGYRKQGGERPD